MWWRAKRGRDVLRPYELQVLDHVRAALTPAAGELLDRHIAATGSVVRLYEDREVNLYPNRRGPQRRDLSIAFPNRSDDLRLATVALAGLSGSGKATVYLVHGHLFQLAFNPSPKRLGDRRSITAERVTIHADPMVPDDGTSSRHWLEQLDAGIRSELETLWEDGGTENQRLSGPDEVYSIDLDDGAYLVLAQFDDTSFLVAPIDPPRPGVRRAWHDGDAMRTYGTVREALAREDALASEA